ncbi:hypothetical protein [Streptomyces carminius]|nr:hypothetical protein [Streptomyces carminius]
MSDIRSAAGDMGDTASDGPREAGVETAVRRTPGDGRPAPPRC